MGFKTFMNPPLKGRECEFVGLCAPDEQALEKIMAAVKQTGLSLTIHCEDMTSSLVRPQGSKHRALTAQEHISAHTLISPR